MLCPTPTYKYQMWTSWPNTTLSVKVITMLCLAGIILAHVGFKPTIESILYVYLWVSDLA